MTGSTLALVMSMAGHCMKFKRVLPLWVRFTVGVDEVRRPRRTAAEKLRIVEETLEDHASISFVAPRNGVARSLRPAASLSSRGGVTDATRPRVHARAAGGPVLSGRPAARLA